MAFRVNSRIRCCYGKTDEFSTDTITFVVGPTDKSTKFPVHANVLKQYCARYDLSLKADVETASLADATDGGHNVRLADQPAVVFQVFVAFIYTGRLSWHTARQTPAVTFALLGRLWVIGQILQAVSFKDAVVNAAAFTTIIKSYPTVMHKTVYPLTSESQRMSKLTYDGKYGRFFYELTLAICEAQLEPERRHSNRIQQLILENGFCFYHEHDINHPCDKPWSQSVPPSTALLILLGLDLSPAYLVQWTSYGEELIDVHVGANGDEQVFRAHSALLSQRSDFFQAAVHKGWKESEEKVVRLPEASPTTFCMFINFIFTGYVPPIIHVDRKSTGEDPEWKRLEEAWLLGEYLLSSSSKDAVVDSIISKHKTDATHPVSMCQAIFKSSPPNAGLRRLLVDFTAYFWTSDELVIQLRLSEFGEFYGALSRVLMSRVNKPNQIAP